MCDSFLWWLRKAGSRTKSALPTRQMARWRGRLQNPAKKVTSIDSVNLQPTLRRISNTPASAPPCKSERAWRATRSLVRYRVTTGPASSGTMAPHDRNTQARLGVRGGNLFTHITNPVFAGQPFTMAAMPDPAPKFALREIRGHCRDKGPRPYAFEPFEYICHTFTVFPFRPSVCAPDCVPSIMVLVRRAPTIRCCTWQIVEYT
jgi:hypothetical protein